MLANIFDTEQITLIAAACDGYFRSHGIPPDSEKREQIALRALTLFAQGKRTHSELVFALEGGSNAPDTGIDVEKNCSAGAQVLRAR